jgi:dimethylhistidine N-methyltransferase
MKESGIKTEISEFNTDVLKGLRSEQKYLPSKYFYDETGSDLFEQICQLDEYYPTDCEVSIMNDKIEEISEFMGEQVQLIELGSGSSMKTRLLIENCKNLDMYVPVDISGAFLQTTAEKLRSDYPDLDIQPLVADYTSSFEIPKADHARKRIVYFPGSTIGNFTQARASEFLNTIGSILKVGDGLLIGVDLKKEVGVLEAAYNDSKGVTAAFNKNILARINEEIGADFDLNTFQHRAF